jgi:glutamate-1-semialdehyde aminotransferase
MAIAVRIARAHTRRDKVVFCGYHGWHDWFLAANLALGEMQDGELLPGLDPLGVPRGLTGTALTFRYNHIEDLEVVATKHGAELAAIVMEPVRHHLPNPGFLEAVGEIAHATGAVLIFDEITAAFRVNCGGIHILFGVNPDIAVFAKAMSNGYPMAAILGTHQVMSAAQGCFISSTNWTERIGPTASLATIRKFQRHDVATHLIHAGECIQSGWKQVADRVGLAIEVNGIPPLSHIAFKYENDQAIATLFTQLMLERGFLASKRFYASYAHQQEHIESYLDAIEEVFTTLSRAISEGGVEALLRGPIASSGFYHLS